MILNYAMDILTKNIEMEVDLPVETDYIDKALKNMGFNALRWAIVNVNDKKITVNVTFENL